MTPDRIIIVANNRDFPRSSQRDVLQRRANSALSVIPTAERAVSYPGIKPVSGDAAELRHPRLHTQTTANTRPVSSPEGTGHLSPLKAVDWLTVAGGLVVFCSLAWFCLVLS